jgi:hypothetical protein
MPPPMTGFITCSPTGAGSCLSPQRATKYFIGEIPRCVIDLVTYVYGEMAYRAPSGAVSLHPSYLKLSQLRTMCEDLLAAHNVAATTSARYSKRLASSCWSVKGNLPSTTPSSTGCSTHGCPTVKGAPFRFKFSMLS